MIDIALIESNKIESVTPFEKECLENLDSTDYAICKRRLEIIGEEAKEVIMRTSVAPTVRAGDVNAAIYTALGDMSISSCGAYVHAFLGELPIKYVLKHYKDDETVGVRDGDIYFTNESRYGGIHNPDMMIYIPIFYNGQLISWAGAVAHEGECGAKDPGGFTPSAATRYDEGMHIAPIKLGENFTIKTDLMGMLENSVRTPRQLTMDLRAQIAACYRIRNRLLEIIEEKGVGIIVGTLKKIIEDNRVASTNKLRAYNDGTYRHVCFMDSVGVGEGLVRMYLTVTKSGDKFKFDFTGSSPQTPGPYNSPRHGVIGFLGSYFAGYICSDMSTNSGIMEPFEFYMPKGSVVNCDEESACTLMNMPVYQAQDLAMHCFAKMMYDSEDRETISADWYSSATNLFYGGPNQRGIPVVGFPPEINAGGGGASNWGDGIGMASGIWAHSVDYGDLEHEEMEYPMLYLYRKFGINRHGYGKHRGGAGLDVAYMVHNTPFVYAGSHGLGNRFPISQGIFGGYADGVLPVLNVTNNNLAELMQASSEDIPYSTFELGGDRKVEGDYEFSTCNRNLAYTPGKSILTMGNGGGGGYGDVLERDPDAVIEDLKQKFITDWVAREIYFLAYDPETFIVNYDRTNEMRQTEREMRKKRGKTYAEFEKQWLTQKPPDDALKYYGSWPDPSILK